MLNKVLQVYRREGVSGVVARIKRRILRANSPNSYTTVPPTSGTSYPTKRLNAMETGSTSSSRYQSTLVPEVTNNYMEDDFITWLKYINPGGLHPGNVLCFDHAIRNLPDNSPILEIGTFAGLSTNIFSYLKWRHKKPNTLITCDRWIFEYSAFVGLKDLDQMKTIPVADTPLSHAKYREFVKESYLRNVQMFTWEALPHTVELFSDEFFAEWEKQSLMPDVFGRVVKLGGSISFCYIDGNHSYDFTKRDFENCDKYLSLGGFVLLDDSADDTSWGSAKVAQEITETEVIKKQRYELVMRNPNYLFKKIKP